MEHTKPVHIMLIDDNEINNFIVKILITKVCKDCSVDIYLSANEALQNLQRLLSNTSALPDLIFFEVNSPDMNGWFFLDEYERLEIDPDNDGRIIVLTCSIYQPDKDKALRYTSVGGYIIKPLTIESLHSVLKIRPVSSNLNAVK